jgi:hypothetical protein
MTQTLYAHMNKIKIKKKRNNVFEEVEMFTLILSLHNIYMY